MSILMRRAFSTYRRFSGTLPAINFSGHRLSDSISRHSSATTQSVPRSFQILEISRGFAKGRRPIKDDVDDDDYENPAAAVSIGPSIKSAAVSQMEAAIDALSRELAKLRTGRASAGMLDHIIVETGGVKTPLCRMAVISVLDPKTLSVTPYDPDAVKQVEKFILSSPFGLNPHVDNQRLIVPIPPLTKEHVQAVCKVVAKSSEDVKQSIRRARQKALDTIKKSLPKKKDKDKTGSVFSDDDAKRLEKEIDDLTKKFIKTAEDMCKSKEKEISSG